MVQETVENCRGRRNIADQLAPILQGTIAGHHLLARRALHAAKGQRTCLAQASHEATHAVVCAVKAGVHQVLINPLRGKTLIQLLQDRLPIRFAGACGHLLSAWKRPSPKPRCRPAGRLLIRSLWRWRQPLRSRWALWLVLNCRAARPTRGTMRSSRYPVGPKKARPATGFGEHRWPPQLQSPSRWALWLGLERKSRPERALRPFSGQRSTAGQSPGSTSLDRVNFKSLGLWPS